MSLNDAPEDDPLAGAMIFPCLLPPTALESEKAQRRRFCEQEWRKGPRRVDDLTDGWKGGTGTSQIYALAQAICQGKAPGLVVPAKMRRMAMFESTSGPPDYDLHMITVHEVCYNVKGERWSLQKFVELPKQLRKDPEVV